MNRQFEQQEEALEESYANGELTEKEYQYEMREMQMSYQAEAEEAAMNAYDNEMSNW
jgi:hypothetical protein